MRIKYVCNDEGNATDVIIPINVWKKHPDWGNKEKELENPTSWVRHLFLDH